MTAKLAPMRYLWSAVLIAFGLQIVGVCLSYGSPLLLPLAALPAAAAVAVIRAQPWANVLVLATSVLAIASWGIALRMVVYDGPFHINTALTALIWLAASVWCPIAVRRIFANAAMQESLASGA